MQAIMQCIADRRVSEAGELSFSQRVLFSEAARFQLQISNKTSLQNAKKGSLSFLFFPFEVGTTIKEFDLIADLDLDLI
jgi:hypothetical protein